MGRFDAALKHSIAAHPADWAHFLGVPEGMPVEAIDADLSAVSLAADKVLRVACEPAMLIHVEFQSWNDPECDDRALFYHAAIRRRERLAVHSVAFVLQPEAWSEANRGGVQHDSALPGCRLEFAYQVIKVWELPPESFLTAGIGLLPLAPLANVPAEGLPAVIEKMTERLSREMHRAEAAELWTATHILMGLKYEPDLVRVMLQNVRSIMVQSTTYQEILREGREKGREEGIVLGMQSAILRQGTQRFGAPVEAARNRLRSIDDPDALDALLVRVLDVASWDELLGSATDG